MKTDRLPVSRKFYKDISCRINDALSGAPASAAEALKLVDSYLTGNSQESTDPLATLAFNMIRAEIDRAISRSQRARERAKIRKNIAETQSQIVCSLSRPSTEKGSDQVSDIETESAPAIPMSRRERRAARHLIRRLNKPRWGAIS